MQYRLKNIYHNIEDIQCKLINFSIDNVKWSCLYSGMGVIDPLTQKDVDHINKAFNSNDSLKTLLSNYVPISCIYDKGSSSFTDPPPEILNPGSYMWDFSSFNKKISIEAQAYAILCLCKSAELLYDQSPAEGYIMLKTARKFYDFISTYLRDDDGLFISGQDKTKNFDKKLKIKFNSDEANLYHQIISLEATFYLHKVTSDHGLREYRTSKSENYLSDGMNIFNYLYDNYELLLDLSTKELSLCISSLSRSFHIVSNDEMKERIKFVISNICAELEARIQITGEVMRGFEDSSIASLITHFRVNSALVEGYEITRFDNFNQSAANICKTLQDLYDSSIGLFLNGSHKSINYSIGDISEVIKHFALNRVVCENCESFESLKEFYYYSLEKTPIIQALARNTINVNNVDYVLTENIPLMDEVNKAPVFLKNFKMKQKKKNVEFETSKYFCSVNGLYSSYNFLYYLDLPIIGNDVEITEQEIPIESEVIEKELNKAETSEISLIEMDED